ncbi:flagellar export protein FliJ [Paenibacillus sp. FSL H7-0331]|jgi:flagellar FliJ protein|uniref:flagellar export protein FliJ n=1 Tax=Paenibacillus sp. FSL H7-0331 TaxID=1920421 RepID=UPI00096C1F0C|nr:flagellar export protein FliJ [Paenibacillus sp. FSL H7-0331]OMF14607.1 flagellar export protein FliJ [Paenibacillus sp. FSL H7-0331]
MRRFKYAFQKIVDLKANEKTQAEWMLSEAIGKVREEESSMSVLCSEKDGLQEQLHSTSVGKTTISEIMLLQHFVDTVSNQIVMKNNDLERAKRVVVTKQDVLAGKVLEEKIWSKAKDKAHQSFAATVLKKEQEQLDEMATNRFRRLS